MKIAFKIVSGVRRSRRVTLGLALTVLLASIMVSSALAEPDTPEPVAGLLVPQQVDSPGELASLTGDDGEVIGPDTDPTAAEEHPLTNLNRNQAEELLEAVFGEGLEDPAELYDELEVRTFRSDHVAVVEPPSLGAGAGLVSSMLPLRAEDESGTKEIVDLGLERVGDHLEPDNPLVEIEIPAQLSDGISLPEAGVTIDLPSGDPAREGTQMGQASAFFPNIRADSDIMVSAVPTGLETFTQLRSPEAPKREVFDLSTPDGSQIRGTDVGGAEVIGPEGSVILAVSAPSALDAEGNRVPAKMEVDGRSLVVSVDPPANVAYPILVDPIFETYNWSSGGMVGGYEWEVSSQPGFGASSSVYPGDGIKITSLEGPTSSGNQGQVNYHVPRYSSDIQAGYGVPTSFIRAMNFWNLTFTIPGVNPPYDPYPFVQLGLWSEAEQQFVSSYHRYGSDGLLTDTIYTYKLSNGNENVAVKHGGAALATFSSWNGRPRYLQIKQAWVEVTDKNQPEIEEFYSVPEWVSTKAGTPIKYKATDTGLGIHNIRLEYLRASGITAKPITGLGCTGNVGSPCPRYATQATKTIPYYPDLIAQGENWAKIYAEDATGRLSAGSPIRIKVDRAKPELLAEDSLTEQAKVGTGLAEYGLYVYASDGDEAAAAATTPFGSAGTAAGQLERPIGVAVDGAGNTWVSDRTNNKIVQYDPTGKVLREISAKGTADGQIGEPRGIAIAPNGNIWVAEAGANKRLQQFTPNGTFVSKID